MEDGFLSFLAGNITIGDWIEIGQFVQTLFSSEHEVHYNKGVERLSHIDFDNIVEDDIKYVQEALDFFEQVNDVDRVYLQCKSWCNLAVCYTLLCNFNKSRKMLTNIEKAQEPLLFGNADEIQRIKDKVPEIRKWIDDTEKEWCEYEAEEELFNSCITVSGCEKYLLAYPEGRYVTKVKEKKLDLEEERDYKMCISVPFCNVYLKKYPQGRFVKEVRDIKAEIKANDDILGAVRPKNDNKGVPMWVLVTVGFFLVAVTILVCYNVFKC